MPIIFVAMILLVAFLFASYKQQTFNLISVILIATIIRLTVTVLFVQVSHHDTTFRKEVATKILKGQNIYFENNGYTTFYLPPSHYLDAIALTFENSGIPQMGTLKGFYILFDIGIIVLLYYLTNRDTKASLLYCLNPISILITNIHGQSDIGSVFFLIASIFLLSTQKNVTSHILFACGVLWKTWPIIFIGTLVRYTGIKYIFITLMLVSLSILSYSMWFRVSLYSMLRPMMSYRGLPGMWGYTSLLFFGYSDYPRLLALTIKLINTLFVILVLFFQIKIPKKNPIYDTFIAMLIFFVGTSGFGMQWSTWITPFLIMIRPRLWRLSITGLTIWLAFSQAPWVIANFPSPFVKEWMNFMIILGWFPWIVFSIMLFFEIRKSYLSHNSFISSQPIRKTNRKTKE